MNKISKVGGILNVPLLQANTVESMLQSMKALMKSPKSTKELSEILRIVDREAKYYIDALISMQMVEVLEYHGNNIYVLSLAGWSVINDADYRKELALFLIDIDYISDQTLKITTSTLAPATKKRRMSAVKAVDKWIKENK